MYVSAKRQEDTPMKEIRTEKDLKKLLERYLEAGADDEWIRTIKGCIEEGLAMDYMDYANTPKELKPLWKGLK